MLSGGVVVLSMTLSLGAYLAHPVRGEESRVRVFVCCYFCNIDIGK